MLIYNFLRFKNNTFFLLRISVNICFLLSCLQASAQRELKAYVNPVPPNVSSFEKYGNTPINYSTGQISQSINLYTLDIDENLKIPIDLIYANSGMKPDEVPSWVGHGWDCMPGGYILQEIRGTSDLYVGGLARDIGQRTNLQNYLNGTMSDFNDRYNYIKNILKGNGDAQPDVFSLNLMGRMTKFYFDGTTPKFIKHEPYKIELINVGGGFIVTDEKGYKFVFNSGVANSGTVSTEPDGEIPTGGAVTYGLDQIITPNNEVVTFEYETDVVYQAQNTNTRIVYGPSLIVDKGFGYDCYSSTIPPKWSSTVTTVAQSVLKKITFRGRVINFGMQEREDLTASYDSHGHALTSVQVLNENNEAVKIVSLNYGFSGRLRLDGLSILDNATQATVQRYRFEYYGDPSTVPLITSSNRSYNLDHWGYANSGFGNTPFNIPDVDYRPMIPNLKTRYLGTNNNNPDDVFSIVGMLHRIFYPTGGYTEIEYEPNQVAFQSLDKKDYLYFMNNPLSTQVLLASTNCAEGSAGGTGGGGYEVGYFTLDHAIGHGSLAWYLTTNNGGIAGCKIWKLDNSGNVIETILDEVGTSTSDSKYLFLAPGQYKYELNSACDEETTQNSVVIAINEDRLPPEGMITKVGGNRVLRIRDYTSSGSLANLRKFKYELSELNHQPQYIDMTQVVSEPAWQMPWEHIICGPVYNIFNHNLTPQVGFPVTYRKVTELLGENGENGKNVYSYPSQAVAVGEYLVSPFPPVVPLNWRDSDLQRFEVYSNANGSFVKQKSTTNIYTAGPLPYSQAPETLKGIAFGRKGSVVLGDENPLHYTEYLNTAGVYYPLDKYGLSLTIDTTFNSNGSFIVEQTANTYTPNDFLVSTVSTTNSEGKALQKHTWYANDFNDGPNLTNQKSKNIIGLPLRVLNSNSGNIVSGEIYTRDVAGNVIQLHNYQKNVPTGIPQHDPHSYYLPDFAEKNSMSYYSSGKLKEYKQTDGMSVVILWGYNSSYPIAEIKNASYQNVLEVLGQSMIDQLSGVSPGTDVQIRGYLSMLRNSPILKNSQITTYTYKPLVGITSMTDTKGMTTYYEYDSFQRLKVIKDLDGNVIKQYDYHYKQP